MIYLTFVNIRKWQEKYIPIPSVTILRHGTVTNGAATDGCSGGGPEAPALKFVLPYHELSRTINYESLLIRAFMTVVVIEMQMVMVIIIVMRS